MLATTLGMKRPSGLLCPSRASQRALSPVQQYCYSLLRDLCCLSGSEDINHPQREESL